MREIRTLRAMRRELETEPRRVLFGHEGGNPGHSQGVPYGPPPSSRPYRGTIVCGSAELFHLAPYHRMSSFDDSGEQE